jgi:hypothetical protein
MSQEFNRSMQPHETKYGGQIAGGLSNQVTALIERLPAQCQTELMKGFTGDLLQLAVKVQEIQATNVEAREHLSALADLLNTVKRDGNRGYAKHTSQNAGGQTTIEIGTGGPLVRPIGGCAIMAAALIAASAFAAVLVCVTGILI